MAKQKKTTNSSKKPTKRTYNRSKSTKSVKSVKAKPKKTGAKKSTSKKGFNKDRKRSSVEYYNQLKSEVSQFYKEEHGKKRLDKTFLEARTKYAFKILKGKAAGGIITDSLYKGFVNNLDGIMHKPASVIAKPDFIIDTSIQIDYWNLEVFIEKYYDELKQYNNVAISLDSILGPGNDQEEEDLDDLDIATVVRDVKKFAIREHKKDDSQFLFFNILKSEDNESLIFELVDQESPDKLRVVDGEMDDTEIPVFEPEPEAKGKKKKVTKGKEKEKEKEKPAETEKISATERAAIERENKKGDLERLTLKKESYQKDIAFNNQQILHTAGLVEVLRKNKIDFSDELEQMVEYKKTNKDLMAEINLINKKLKDL